MGMDMMGGMGEEKLNPLMQFYMSLPEWGQALARTLIVILAAALIGMILGRLGALSRSGEEQRDFAEAAGAVFGSAPGLRFLALSEHDQKRRTGGAGGRDGNFGRCPIR